MLKNKKSSISILKSFFAAGALFTLSYCSHDEEIKPNPSVNTSSAVTTTEATASEPSMESLTIDGIFSLLSPDTECKTCTYVIPATAEVVDGKELHIKAGDVICINSALKYGHLKLINLDGDAEHPVIIGYAKNPVAVPSASAHDKNPVKETTSDLQ
jgi:hypothetical protein